MNKLIQYVIKKIQILLHQRLIQLVENKSILTKEIAFTGI